ncbi:Zn-dependent protease with chaperone function [Scytonema hofmannii PCC 7110]|uniref:Zn-dependent protease with chaperone function n=1 Tax=Scytonema hofmannii PCC 7110 TaxID=128403 RepID=A0A139X1X6_9CYAN|nr:zinc metalloprotease HtpX [Scytonema hofmannii]KYC38711.1 Zn-dependent protease with chaperone function [Scytonema hofmannii PCC 7110]
MPSQFEPSLEAGLNILKQGNYQSAIATLKAVAAREGNSNAGLQAQIGLVVAYTRSGNTLEARTLCKTLTQSHNTQVQEWAQRTLKHLTQPSKTSQPKTDTTGFVAFDGDKKGTRRHGDKETQGQGEISSPPLPLPPSPPPVSPPPVAIREPIKPLTIYWKQAPRAKSWQPLQKLNLIPFRLLQAGTFIALFWIMRELLIFAMQFINNTLMNLPYLEPIQLLYADPTFFLLLTLFFLIGLSPWLLDGLLINFYYQREFNKDTLNKYSQEAVRVLQRYCQQQGWKLPKLGVLPLSAPIVITYGNLRRTARIVVSQGLLEQLAEDEIAAIYARSLGHIAHWDFVVMSLVLLVTIPFYLLYQQIAIWGDKREIKVLRVVLAYMSSFAYGIWCLLTGTSLWLSQLRHYYSDRIAADITGNPNGLVRGLLKIAIGIASDIQKQEHTCWQLESLNIMAPVGYQQSICLGSIAPHTTFESFLMWDTLNPYRWWFIFNKTHPLMGDRLQHLTSIARLWRLDTELNMENQKPLKVKRQSFLFQIAPFLGIPVGILFAFLIWILWQTAYALKFLNLKWIYDNSSYVTGCLLICIGIGIIVRINAFFPSIKSLTVQTDNRLPVLLANPASLPVDSTPVHLVGKLLGRRGNSNFLGQDLILQTSTSLVKLHYIPQVGEELHTQALIGRRITVTGWLRKGSLPWIDIHTLNTQSGKTVNSYHPVLSIILAIAFNAWGVYVLFKG